MKVYILMQDWWNNGEYEDYEYGHKEFLGVYKSLNKAVEAAKYFGRKQDKDDLYVFKSEIKESEKQGIDDDCKVWDVAHLKAGIETYGGIYNYDYYVKEVKVK